MLTGNPFCSVWLRNKPSSFAPRDLANAIIAWLRSKTLLAILITPASNRPAHTLRMLRVVVSAPQKLFLKSTWHWTSTGVRYSMEMRPPSSPSR